MLQWRIEKEKKVESETPIMEYNSGVPVSKISYVTKGLGNEILRKAAKKQRGSRCREIFLIYFLLLSVSVDLCFVMQGPATEDFPNGFDFGIKCKTKAVSVILVLFGISIFHIGSGPIY